MVVVHMVLLYGSEIWAIMESMMQVLEGLRQCIANRITGKIPPSVKVEGWEWSPNGGGPGGDEIVAHAGVNQTAPGYH